MAKNVITFVFKHHNTRLTSGKADFKQLRSVVDGLEEKLRGLED